MLFFQVLAPEEEEFPFRRPVRFRSLENAGMLKRVDPMALRAGYLERFRAHCEGLRESCGEIHADYHKVSTADDVGKVLLDYLAARAFRGVLR